MEKIGRVSVRVNYDTANVEFYSGERAEDDLPKITRYLAHVHLKDTTGGKGNWDFGTLGTGHVDFRRVREILDSAGYAGPYSVELEFQGEPWPSLKDVNEAMRRSYDHLTALGY
jgi:sugar phosphate isomerase/epimerase